VVGGVYLLICLPGMVGGCIPPYMPPCTTLGTPPSSDVIHADTPPGYTAGSEESPGLNPGNNRGNEAHSSLSSPKGVTDVRGFCAELLRFSGRNRMKDWIDEG